MWFLLIAAFLSAVWANLLPRQPQGPCGTPFVDQFEECVPGNDGMIVGPDVDITSLTCPFTISATLDKINLLYAIFQYTPRSGKTSRLYSYFGRKGTSVFSAQNGHIVVTTSTIPSSNGESYELQLGYKNQKDTYASQTVNFYDLTGMDFTDITVKMRYKCINGARVLTLLPPNGKIFLASVLGFQLAQENENIGGALWYVAPPTGGRLSGNSEFPSGQYQAFDAVINLQQPA